MEFLNNKINSLTREFLYGLISHSDQQARKATRKEFIELNNGHIEKYLNKVPMIIDVKVLRTTFKEPLNFHMIIECENSNTTPQKTQSRYKSFDSNWKDDRSFEFLMEKIDKNGIFINFRIIKENKYLFNNIKSLLTINLNKEFIGTSLEIKKQIYFEKLVDEMNDEEIGTIEFEVTLSPIKNFGLRYWERLPVFDPNFTLPSYAMPSDSFVHHDEFNELIVAFVIVYWLLRGEKNAWDMLPPNTITQHDLSTTDEFFTSRRLNGCNRPYNQFELVENKQWQYEVKLNFRGYEIKKDVWFPDNTCCRFVLTDGGDLKIHSIAYQMSENEPVIEQLADGSDEWNQLKIKYMMIEFNYNINWGHVGVHFIVEMYNMAFYRKIINNPIKKLLWPHFDGVIFNNWLVVRPMIDGVVTQAAAFTYEGQVQMLREKFKHLTYKWEPKPLPENIKNNLYDPADQSIWNAIKEYVDDFFKNNQSEILKYWNEIEQVSQDLLDHTLNENKDQVEIKTIQDLQQCSVYIIYQAVFRHAWIHWKAWDEEAQAIMFNENGSTSLKDIKWFQKLGNAIEAGVQYPSPYVRQYPILDSEFGGPELLQQKIWENAHKINPAISIGSLIISPNI